MRLWHKDLIAYLPKKQLVGQWRECCCIAKNISLDGTPNHLLVNKIMRYPMTHFFTYGYLVYMEMSNRGYKCDVEKFTKYFTYPHETSFISFDEVFGQWHNDRYLRQCVYNLQEKYDCGGLDIDEWRKILDYLDKWKCDFIKGV